MLAEQVNLAIPMNIICRSDCRGLCPHCGANLNNEECRCEKHGADPRLAPLARPAFEWNHDWVMARGGEGIAQLLGCRLLASD